MVFYRKIAVFVDFCRVTVVSCNYTCLTVTTVTVNSTISLKSAKMRAAALLRRPHSLLQAISKRLLATDAHSFAFINEAVSFVQRGSPHTT